MLYLKAFLAWFLFGVTAVLLGVARENFLRPRLPDLAAHQVETLVVCAVIFALTIAFVHWALPSASAAWSIGCFWVILTLAFEIGIFHFVLGKPMAELTADFNILRGHLWPLVLLTELIGPAVARSTVHARSR
jgi:hypothetical protein